MAEAIERGRAGALRSPVNLTDNPIVHRALRTGRAGTEGRLSLGRLGGWLGLALLIPFVPIIFGRPFRLDQVAGTMLVTLFCLVVGAFLFIGLQRMLGSFMKEREQNTLEFLQLSTLPSVSVILGYLAAGQLPGYFAAVLLTPLLFLCAHLASFPLLLLGSMLLSLIGFVFLLSVIFLHVGFWSAKVSELRAGGLYGTLFVIFVIAATFRPLLTQSGVVGAEWIDVVFTPFQLWGDFFRGFSGAPLAGGGDRVFWYGFSLPRVVAGWLLHIPVGVLLLLSLARAFRNRECAPWSTGSGLCLVSWTLCILLGVLVETGRPLSLQLPLMGALAYLVCPIPWRRNLRTRLQALHELSRSGGSWRGAWTESGASPVLLVGGSILLTVVSCWLVLLLGGGAPGEGPVPQSAWFAPLLLVLPLLGLAVGQQALHWRAPRLRFLLIAGYAFLVFAPLIFHWVEVQAPFPVIPEARWALEAFSCVSPLVVMSMLAAGEGPGLPAILAGQLVFLLPASFGLRDCWRVGARLADRAREGGRGDGPIAP
ncbi:MAG: hypothetical protein ACO4CW_06355 [Planctomycetota bacterium]|jgi:hypothetical protein